MNSERRLKTITDQMSREMTQYLGMLPGINMGSSGMDMKMSLESHVKEILNLDSLVR